MTFHFRYKLVKYPDGGLGKVPAVPVTLIGPSGKFLKVIALVDSGADYSVVSREVGDLLGFDLTEGKVATTYGIGGTMKTLHKQIIMKFGRNHELYSWGVPVKILLDSVDFEIPPLIGRSGFFEQFEITFDERRERIAFKKVPGNSPAVRR